MPDFSILKSVPYVYVSDDSTMRSYARLFNTKLINWL